MFTVYRTENKTNKTRSSGCSKGCVHRSHKRHIDRGYLVRQRLDKHGHRAKPMLTAKKMVT
jgi:hypothetical protein